LINGFYQTGQKTIPKAGKRFFITEISGKFYVGFKDFLIIADNYTIGAIVEPHRFYPIRKNWNIRPIAM